MAKKKQSNPGPELVPREPIEPEGFKDAPIGPVKLSPERRAQLEALGPAIEMSKKEISVMKKAGMDVAEVETKILQAEHMRTVLLEGFK